MDGIDRPLHIRGGFFLADWTFGRIYSVPRERAGAPFTSKPELFIESVGENGFAPTDLAVHPTTGDLFISIGGRGTRGAVFRVRFPRGQREFGPSELARLKPQAKLPTGPRSTTANPCDASIAAVRELQLRWGGIGARQFAGTIWEGYSLAGATHPRDIDPPDFRVAVTRLRASFPSGQADLDREISRTLAMIEDDDEPTLGRVASKLSADSDPVEDIHYLAVLARLRGPRQPALAARVARALLDLDRKIIERSLNRDRHWPLRVAELHAELARRDPQLNDALLNHSEFGRPDHVLFAQCPGFDRVRAARVFLDRSSNDADFQWTPALVELAGNLPDTESLPELRKRWENLGLQEAILHVLARNPQPSDRAKFFDSLNSPQLATVRECLEAIAKLPVQLDGRELLALVRTLRRLQGGKEEDKLRRQVGELLQILTGATIEASNAGAWTDWFTKTQPELARSIRAVDGVDIETWRRRLAQVDWGSGNGDRGQAVFARTGCTACHSGARAIGPDLRGAASRFSREDLFTAILQPSRDVSPRYQTTLVATADGKLYQGMIIYEAVDSLILQTGADSTIRITNNQVVERRVTPNSLMPAGLLDKLTEREIADLYAYLKSMR